MDMNVIITSAEAQKVVLDRIETLSKKFDYMQNFVDNNMNRNIITAVFAMMKFNCESEKDYANMLDTVIEYVIDNSNDIADRIIKTNINIDDDMFMDVFTYSSTGIFSIITDYLVYTPDFYKMISHEVNTSNYGYIIFMDLDGYHILHKVDHDEEEQHLLKKVD